MALNGKLNFWQQILLNQMSNCPENLFYQLSLKVNNKVYLEQLMVRQNSFFDIQPFKIDKLYAEAARKIYNQIRFKYEVSKQYLVNPTFWYENQRKIFIWFIVCYFHQNQIINIAETNLDWEQLSRVFFNKHISFLQFQYQNILKQKNRISWTQEQDDILLKAAEQQGPGSWNEISKYIYFNSSGEVFKSPKHCRQRWLNHLDQTKIKGKWTEEEDYKMLAFIRENGKKWSRIAQLLNFTRTQHMVKNRYNSLMTKVRKNKKEKQIETISRILRALSSSLKIEINDEEKMKKSCCFIQTCDSHQQSSEKLQNRKFEIPSVVNVNQNAESQLGNSCKISLSSRKGFTKINRMENVANLKFNSLFMQYLDNFPLELRPSILFLYGLPTSQQQEREYVLSQGINQQEKKQSSTSFYVQSIRYKTQPVYIIQKNGLINLN